MDVTIADILEFDLVRAGDPHVLAGTDQLDTGVRWVHIAEMKNLTGLLQGGELVLTTGMTFTGRVDEVEHYLTDLADAGAAGVVVEIIPGRERVSAAVTIAAHSATIPVIVLSRRVRFVELTEKVHQLIVTRQLAEVDRARHVHEIFTELSMAGARLDEIVAQTAKLLRAPVVLENLSHNVIGFAGAGMPIEDLLRDWERRSRHIGDDHHPGSAEPWLFVSVGPRGAEWGRLIVPAPDVGQEAVMILERASQALSISRMSMRDQHDLAQKAQAGLIHELRESGSVTEGEALARASALGLTRAPTYLPVVIRLGRSAGHDPLALQRHERTLLELTTRSLQDSGTSAIAASLHAGSVALVIAVANRQREDPVLMALCAGLERHGAAGRSAAANWTIGVGAGRDTVLVACTAGLDEAVHVAEAAATSAERRLAYYRSRDVRLRGLLGLIRDDPRVQTFVETELGPLLAGPHDADLQLLRVYLELEGNKAAVARALYLSRPTLYGRIRRLEKTLGTSLTDPQSRVSLHVALLVHQFSP